MFKDNLLLPLLFRCCFQRVLVYDDKDFSDAESESLSPGKETREDKSDENLSEEVVKEEEPVQLQTSYSREAHRLMPPCCEFTNPLPTSSPVPAPARVYHPNLNLIGYFDCKNSKPDSNCHLFTRDT